MLFLKRLTAAASAFLIFLASPGVCSAGRSTDAPLPDLNLPSLGTVAGADLSLQDERDIGEAFMKEIRSYSEDLISEIKQGQGSFRHDNMTGKRCPQCGKFLLSVKGKNSEMLVCQDRECGYRETVARTSNARCPVCHKRMELRGKGDGQIFVCSCGHREKLSAFKSRREKEGAGISKKDVARYLNRQKREAEEPVNNAFAAALAGIRLDDQ